MSIAAWGYIWLSFYMVAIGYLGYLGFKKTVTSDDYAVARGGYPWWLMSFSFIAATASGSTFLGIPGMAYSMGFMALYYPFIYPIGIYLGMMTLVRRTKKMGDRLGSQTVPDYLGDYYQSKLIRVIAALLSLFLIYYVMAQMIGVGHTFMIILGIDYQIGIWIGGAIVVLYMMLGGSHSDIMTDALQGLLMTIITIIIVIFFFTGFGVEGFGAGAVNAALPEGMRWNIHFNPANATFYSPFVIFMGMFFAHLGFVILPHLGNKFFALRGTGTTRQYNIATNILGLLMGAMVLGGLLGKAIGLEVRPDQVIPALFVALLPPVLAGLLSITILSAIISTADGLMMSLSQIFANDLYRKTFVPLTGGDPNSIKVDKNALLIGRIGVVASGFVSIWLIRNPPELLSILLWVGVGGIIAALSGPFFLATFWPKSTKMGALVGMITSFAFYFYIHLGPQFGLYEGFFPYNKNPFLSSGVGIVISVTVTFLVSLVTAQLPQDHIKRLWSSVSDQERSGIAG